MAPPCRKRTRSIKKSSSKRKPLPKKNDHTSVASSPAKTPVKPHNSPSEALEGSNDAEHVGNVSICCTPKAERYRIPEIKTCPPAPKKTRGVTTFSLRRSPIKFYTPSDMEMMFYFTLRGIPV